MKKIIAIWVVVLAGFALVNADTVTTRMGLTQPSIGSTGWGNTLNSNFGIMDSSGAIQGLFNNFTSSNTFNAITQISSHVYVNNSSSVTITGSPDNTLTFVGSVNSTGPYKSNGTVGTRSLSCSSGQTFDSPAVNGGIITAGSCHAYGTGAGDVQQAGTNNMSGQTTFLVNSTITFNQGFTTSGSTITMTQHVISTGTSVILVSTSPARQNMLSFTGFDPDAHYKIEISSITGVGTGSTTFLAMQVNGDAGANYAYSTAQLNAGANSFIAATAQNFCLMHDNSGIGGPTAGRSGFGQIDFWTGKPNSPGAALLTFDNMQHDATNARYAKNYGWCAWSTGTAITQVTIFYTAGGQFSGVFNVWKVE